MVCKKASTVSTKRVTDSSFDPVPNEILTMNRLEDIFFAIISFSSHRTLDCVGALVAKPGGNDNGVVWVTHSTQLRLSNPINYWLSSSFLVVLNLWIGSVIVFQQHIVFVASHYPFSFFHKSRFPINHIKYISSNILIKNKLATKRRQKRSCTWQRLSV